VRQVDAVRTFNRSTLYPGQRGPARSGHWQNILESASTQYAAGEIGMVFEATPFPMSIYDNIAFGVRLYESLGQRADGRARRMALTRRDVGRGEDKLRRAGWRLGGRSSACASPVRFGQPEVLLARRATSAVDRSRRANERTDHGAQTTTHRHRDAQCSKAARVSDYTAYMYWANWIEFSETINFLSPAQGDRDYITAFG